jgi:hypothetical protein
VGIGEEPDFAFSINVIHLFLPSIFMPHASAGVFIFIEWRVSAAVEDHEIEITKTIYSDGLSQHTLFETRGDILAAYTDVHNTYKKLSRQD